MKIWGDKKLVIRMLPKIKNASNAQNLHEALMQNPWIKRFVSSEFSKNKRGPHGPL